MNRDDAIRQGLRAAGIPVQVYGTTLMREGQPELRELVSARRFTDPSNPMGVFLYPETRNAAMQARKVFGLIAKEVYLSGTPVAWMSLAAFLGLYAADSQDDMEKAAQAKAVFLTDFYETGAQPPFSAQDATRLRYWVRSRVENGTSVSFLSDAPLDKASVWWPPTFLDFLRGCTIPHAVKAPA